ncbi:putative peptidoglycan glycosyltransferase FtsW [Candidatus Entotheonellaceae bacterium PAL068K]
MTSTRRTDAILLTVTLILVAIGLAMVYSSSAIVALERYGDSLYFLKRQSLWAGLGLVAMWGARCMPYRVQQKLTMPAVFGTLGALILVLLPEFGKEVGGARRWLLLGPLTVQPSEVAKYVLILYVARTLGRSQERVSSFAYGYLPNLLMMALFALLVFSQPDLGTAVVLATAAGCQLLIAGVPFRYLGYTVLAGLPLLYWGLVHVRFRLQRLLVFLDPWADPQGGGYQAIQATLALGKGGLFGVGLGQSQQKLFYLPEAHTDFIFAVIGEELGFIGTVGLIVLFGLLLGRILRIALRCDETFGTHLGLGVFVLLALQIAVNLGVVGGLLPTKGLPLPLISLGGSNLLVSMSAIGTMLNMAESQVT